MNLATRGRIGLWDTSMVDKMISAFSGRSEFNEYIGDWNTSSVTDMTSMFLNATVFNKNIGSWNTSNVENMLNMFRDATVFNKNIGSWNTSNVENMSAMFFSASKFNQDIGSWDTSNVKNMTSMFSGASEFNQDIRSWKVSAPIFLVSMFLSATNMIDTYEEVEGFGETPTVLFFNFVPPEPPSPESSSQPVYSFGMSVKNSNMTQSEFAMSRILFRKTTKNNNVPIKQYKTQNVDTKCRYKYKREVIKIKKQGN